MTRKSIFRGNRFRDLSRNALLKFDKILVIFLTCLLIYTITWSGHHYSIDGVVMFQYTKALFFDHSFIMVPPVRWGFDIPIGHWPIGLSLFYIPILAILSQTIFRGDDSIRKIPFNPDLTHNPILLANRPYLFSSFLNPLITAFSAVILYLLCLKLGFSKKKASAVALVFALASPAAAYAKFDFAQPLASLFLLLMFLLLIKAKHNGLVILIGAGITFGIAILTRPELLSLTPIFLVAVFFLNQQSTVKPSTAFTKQIHNLLCFGLPVTFFVLINQYINYLRFGSWFRMGYNPSSDFSLNLLNISIALVGNLFSPGRGILIFFPLSVLSVLGLRKLFLIDRWLAWVLTGLIFGSLLLYSAWKDWGAGISWGPRFFIPLLPYLTLLAFLGFDAFNKYPKHTQVTLIGTLIVLGWFVSLNGLLFNYLGFYGAINLPQKVIDQGDYNFLPRYSPVLMGWESLTKFINYDIYWIQIKNIQASNGGTLIVMFTCLIAMGYLLKSWFDYYYIKKPEITAD